MFSGIGATATEKPSASTDKRKLDASDPWAAYRSESEQYNFNKDALFTGSLNKDANIDKDERQDEGPASQVRTPQEPDLSEIIKKALLGGFKGAKSKDHDKPKAKEADKIERPEFPRS